jgi:hypothetical protein
MTEEKKFGTARFALDLIYKYVAVQIAYTIFAVLILFCVFKIGKTFSSGIWAVYFVFLTVRCMKNPDGFSQ